MCVKTKFPELEESGLDALDEIMNFSSSVYIGKIMFHISIGKDLSIKMIFPRVIFQYSTLVCIPLERLYFLMKYRSGFIIIRIYVTGFGKTSHKEVKIIGVIEQYSVNW